MHENHWIERCTEGEERQQIGILGANWTDILSLGHGLTFVLFILFVSLIPGLKLIAPFTLAPILMNLICIIHSDFCTFNRQCLFMKNMYDFEFFFLKKLSKSYWVTHILLFFEFFYPTTQHCIFQLYPCRPTLFSCCIIVICFSRIEI